MKLLREYRLLSASGFTLLVLDCKFTEKAAKLLHATYTEQLATQRPIKLVAVDVLGYEHELDTEGL
jgi:hypothetical protein